MTFARLFLYSLGVSSLLLAIYTSSIIRSENRALLIEATWTAKEFLEQDAPVELLALSNRSDSALIDGCMKALFSISGRLLVSQDRDTLLNNCGAIFGEIARSSTSNAYAWFAVAYIANEQGLSAQFNDAVQNSYDAGPSEQWISELRANLAEDAFAELSAPSLRGHNRDLAVLVQSRRGIGKIARRYISYPLFRERITKVVETLSPANQRRFLRILQHEVRRFENGN